MRIKVIPNAQREKVHLERFPRMSVIGSVEIMKLRYFGENTLLVRSGDYIYCVGNLRAAQKRDYLIYGERIYFNVAH